jgi:hypothetical protein
LVSVLQVAQGVLVHPVVQEATRISARYMPTGVVVAVTLLQELPLVPVEVAVVKPVAVGP